MKTLFKQIIVGCFIFGIGIPTFAAKEDVSYSGYYVDRLIYSTGALLMEKQLLFPQSDTAVKWYEYFAQARDQQDKGMLPSILFMDFEQSFLNYCIEKRLITVAQVNIVLDTSKHCGGLTINGYNLLILHAGVVGRLIDNKHLTLKEGQQSLDSSRKKY